jgi:hypothetical protein
VLIIKSQLKKKNAKLGARGGMKCCAVKSALKVAGKVFIKQLVRLDK